MRNPAFFLMMILLLLQNTIFNSRNLLWDNAVRYVLYAVLYSYLLAKLVSWLGSRWLKVILYLFFLTICIINFFLFFHFKSSISPATIMLLMETNAGETAEFLQTYLITPQSLQAMGMALLGAFTIIALERKERHLIKVCRDLYGKSLFKHFLWFILVLGIISHYIYFPLFQCRSTVDVDEWVTKYHAKPMDNISNLFFCAFDIYLAKKEQSRAIESLEQSLQAEATATCDSIDVVLVIGESYIKWHSSLYGYELNTTPMMLKEQELENLYVFTNVVAPYNLTSKVLRNVFSSNSIGNKELWCDYPFFPAIFRKAGYRVLFWDNQYDATSKESFDFSLNAYIHNPIISRWAYDATNKDKYELDGEMLASYSQTYQQMRGHNFLSIFHLMGQHVAYYNRFPHDALHTHFTKDSIRQQKSWMTDEKRQLVADYDNATYYNDIVMGSIFDMFRNKNAVVVYFSDHGEEVYDYQDHAGRCHDNRIDRNLVKYQYEVPFIIWCSDRFKSTFPSQVERIKHAVDKPLMLDNICHMLFSLAGINTPYYEPRRNVLDTAYSCPPRIINDFIDIDKDIH